MRVVIPWHCLNNQEKLAIRFQIASPSVVFIDDLVSFILSLHKFNFENVDILLNHDGDIG